MTTGLLLANRLSGLIFRKCGLPFSIHRHSFVGGVRLAFSFPSLLCGLSIQMTTAVAIVGIAFLASSFANAVCRFRFTGTHSWEVSGRIQFSIPPLWVVDSDDHCGCYCRNRPLSLHLSQMRFAVFDSLCIIRSEDSELHSLSIAHLEHCQFEWTATVAVGAMVFSFHPCKCALLFLIYACELGLWVTVAIAISGGGV